MRECVFAYIKPAKNCWHSRRKYV